MSMYMKQCNNSIKVLYKGPCCEDKWVHCQWFPLSILNILAKAFHKMWKKKFILISSNSSIHYPAIISKKTSAKK